MALIGREGTPVGDPGGDIVMSPRSVCFANRRAIPKEWNGRHGWIFVR